MHILLVLLLFLVQAIVPQTVDGYDNNSVKQAQAYYKAAFQLAQSTGDFWVAEKLLQASVCMARDEHKFVLALGDVQMKLGRPAEAMKAWRRALRLDPSLSSLFSRRMRDLQAISNPSRFSQALETTNSSEWSCPASHLFQLREEASPLERKKSLKTPSTVLPASTPSSKRAPQSAMSVHSLFPSPLVVVNVTAWRIDQGQTPLDHASLLEVAMAGYREANRGGPMVDEVHGPLTPNNQFFEFQMAHLNEASPSELKRAGVGWEQLSALPSWLALVDTVRNVVRTSSTLQEFAPIHHHRPTPAAAGDSFGSGDSEEERSPPLYGWFSVHQGPSEHASHAHLDARLSAVYYVEVMKKKLHAL
jgi:tetratricopeptide (TPR) repeat protein